MKLTSHMAAATADWLRSFADQKELESQLRKAACRKRPEGGFTILLARRHAPFFRQQMELFTVSRGGTVPSMVVLETISTCHRALMGGRGRPQLSLGQLEDQEADRTQRGSAGDGGRHKRRIVSKAGSECAWRDFRTAGKSILGSIEDVPKK